MPTSPAPRRFPASKQKVAPTDLSARRVPTQDRSRQRVERILDAAAQTFAEIGYEAATTEAIAERAGTSIGSVYQFFPNKRALYDAIARRYLDRSRALFDGLMSPGALTLPWYELLDLAIDGFASLDRGDFDLRAVWVNWHLSSSFYSEGRALNREFAKRAEAVLSKQSRGLTPAKRALVSTIIVEVMSAMLFLAARSNEARAAEVVAETKMLLRRYLEPLVKPATARRGKVRA
jgi:AcrR family transcriptional regulator